MVVKNPQRIFLHHHDADLSLPLTLAVESALAAGSRTQAAHEAGLADSAHRNRIFGRASGLASSSLMAQ